MWIKILQLILSLSLLVIVHEFGHFIFAKLFKCRVEKFYLFFNPWFSLFKFRIGETTYGMGWVPFGGYVKISGMIDESMDTEQLKEPAKPYEFRSKPSWQRLLIMVGGVAMNAILAAMIYIGISFTYGDSYISVNDSKYGFEYSNLAQQIGFRNGDIPVSVEGESIDDYTQVIKSILFDQAQYVDVKRNDEIVRININSEFIPKILKEKVFISPRIPFVVNKISQNGTAAKAGMLAGDTIIGVNGKTATFTQEIIRKFTENSGKVVTIDLARDSAGVKQLLTYKVEVSKDGKIGVALVSPLDLINISTKEYNLITAIPAGIHRAGTELSNYVKQFKLIFNPETEAYKSLGGFIAIGNIFPETWSWYSFWNITALLSIMLAVMNILPIPALDGGHIMFLLYEVVTRRKPSDKFMERAQTVGLILLFGLLLFANGNDVFKLITGWLS